MKKSYIITLTIAGLCTGITLSSFMLKTAGMHPSSTGAPGEWTCANALTGCHANATITNDNTNIVNTLTYSASDSSYVPGQTYTLTLKALKSGITKFGFGMVALQNSNTANTGTFVITDANRTQIISGTGALSTRKYTTHKTNGTPAVSPGLGQWTFNWTAPSANVGDITFYYASNCTNNNGTAAGDQLYLSSFTIHPFSGTSIEEFVKDEAFQSILNPSLNELILNYELLKECELSVSLFDAQGKMIKSISSPNQPAGEYSDHINLSMDLGTGIYFVHVNINDQTLTRKIMIQ
ncbi:MAG: T9SS type A sorting domain-containing protein [Bacteroidetes bacterium]|nr:MAG: T9SS type A sorting domain-containing protein [Bacteroidota bacterium]